MSNVMVTIILVACAVYYPEGRVFSLTLLGIYWIGRIIQGYFQCEKEYQEWDSNQKPRAEGYNPNNQWEYIEEPSTPSETNSQTPPNPRQ